MSQSIVKPTSITTTGFLDISGTIISGSHITANAGDIKTLVGNIQSETTVHAGTGINTTTGDIQALAGDVRAQNNITSHSGNITAGVHVIATGFVSAGTDVNAGRNVNCPGGVGVGVGAVTGEVKSSGSIHAGGDITAVGTIQAGTGITCVANNIGANNGNMVAAGTYPAGRVVADNDIVAGQSAFSQFQTNTAGGELQLTQGSTPSSRLEYVSNQEAGSGWYSHPLTINRFASGFDIGNITNTALSRMFPMEMEVVWLIENLNGPTTPGNPPPKIQFWGPGGTANVETHFCWVSTTAGLLPVGAQSGTVGTYLMYSGAAPTSCHSNKTQKLRIRMGESNSSEFFRTIELYFQCYNGIGMASSRNIIQVNNTTPWYGGIIRILTTPLGITPHSVSAWYALPRATFSP